MPSGFPATAILDHWRAESAMDKSLRQSVVIALLVAGALFMEQLDGTVIATALPQMAQSFGVAAVDLNIGMSAYLLTVAVFIPASGWVTDRFGARTVFAAAIVTFTLSSVLCAASGTSVDTMRAENTEPVPNAASIAAQNPVRSS